MTSAKITALKITNIRVKTRFAFDKTNSQGFPTPNKKAEYRNGRTINSGVRRMSPERIINHVPKRFEYSFSRYNNTVKAGIPTMAAKSRASKSAVTQEKYIDSKIAPRRDLLNRIRLIRDNSETMLFIGG